MNVGRTPVHAVFDIGKTNKKLFLFDVKGDIVWEANTTFEAVEDEEGFPSDDLTAIESWMLDTMEELFHSGEWQIKSINFSGYGASIVYLDGDGKRLPLFINYIKPYPEALEDQFFEKYGPKLRFCKETASPYLGMLNSGLQIYWLKHEKPEWFKQVRYVLHFPQYLSYLFSQITVTEYTSIGCHTAMWDYEKQDYHRWIYDEDIIALLPPVRPSDDWLTGKIKDYSIAVGMGLHDTSASLIPYLKIEEDPFLLLSTGTWTLSVNPFSNDALSEEDLENDSLNYLRIDGGQVRATRLFLGREHEIQVGHISASFGVNADQILQLKWNKDDYESSKKAAGYNFKFEHLKPGPIKKENQSQQIPSWKDAYYQLMDLLVPLQVEAIHRAMGSQNIRRLIIEGGFVRNQIFVALLREHLPDHEVVISDIKGGSARGVFELVESLP